VQSDISSSEEIGSSAKTAHVVGDFNGWSDSETPMKKLKSGAFSTILDLEQGREYQFRYLLDKCNWQNDVDADKFVVTPFGDMGIDAAVFWRHLFYDRYPINYEETRESNPENFLLSGIFAANYVNTSSSVFLVKMGGQQSLSAKLPFWEVLAEKKNAGCATVNKNLAESEQYLEIYQRLLRRSLLQHEREKLEFNAVAH
jgi:hypothetical protein